MANGEEKQGGKKASDPPQKAKAKTAAAKTAAAKKAPAKKRSARPAGPTEAAIRNAAAAGMVITATPLGQKSAPVDPTLGTTAAIDAQPAALIELDAAGKYCSPKAPGQTFETVLALLDHLEKGN
jgi:hypothetical protein